MNRLSLLFVIGVILTLAVGGLAGYTYLSGATSTDTIRGYDLQIESLKNDLAQYKGDKLNAALSAKQVLDDLKSGYVEWSTVIEKILATTPKDEKTKTPIVEYTSYSGAENSDISINVRTVPGSTLPFSDVAKLIRAFEDSDYFKNPFVPAISTSTDKDGNLVLVFNFNFDLAEGKDLTADVQTSDAKPETSVPKAPTITQ